MATAASSATAQDSPRGGLHTALWVAQFLLACAFGTAGLGKATDPIAELVLDLPWIASLPVPLVRFIGGVEFLGALGLILPSFTGVRPGLTPLAALGLALVMLLAAGFHLSRGETVGVAVTATLGAMAVFIAWGRLRKVPIKARS